MKSLQLGSVCGNGEKYPNEIKDYLDFPLLVLVLATFRVFHFAVLHPWKWQRVRAIRQTLFFSPARAER